MITKNYEVPGINCGNCTATIERELSALQDVISVHADAKTKQVVVQTNNEDALSVVESTLKEIDFPPR